LSNVVITWKDPVVAAGIEFIAVLASVDDVTYSEIATIGPGVQTLTDQDVAPGKWFYSVVVVPKKGALSDPVKGSIEVPFPKAGQVTDLKLVLA
jgi:hypothetical protein